METTADSKTPMICFDVKARSQVLHVSVSITPIRNRSQTVGEAKLAMGEGSLCIFKSSYFCPSPLQGSPYTRVNSIEEFPYIGPPYKEDTHNVGCPYIRDPSMWVSLHRGSSI